MPWASPKAGAKATPKATAKAVPVKASAKAAGPKAAAAQRNGAWHQRGKGGATPALTNGGGWGGGWGTQGTANAAIREITEQLRSPGNPGHVWIQDWGRRYQSVLGPLRGFLEGNPDHFTVTQEGGNRFSVALVKGSGWKRSSSAGKGGGGSWGGKGWGKGSWGGGAQMAIGNGGWDPVVAAAIREIKEQLLAPGSDGTVWVEKWGPRFQDYLGPLRAFMESRPDKFNIVPGEGRKYTVEYVGGGTATGATPVPRKRSAGEGSQSPNAKRPKAETAPAEDVKINPEDLTEMALEEVTKILQKPGNKGHVWVKDWPRRYGDTLGTLRDFLECYPERFTVVEGEGKKFTVELVSP